jgi:outer membrane autotransporter protein
MPTSYASQRTPPSRPLHPAERGRRRLSRSSALSVAVATALLALSAPAAALNECGTTAVVVCALPPPAYGQGIVYQVGSLDLTLASGTVVDTSAAASLPSGAITTVGIGAISGSSASPPSPTGDVNVVIEQGASVITTQTYAIAARISDHGGKINARLSNAGSLTRSGMNYSTVFIDVRGSIDFRNSGDITATGQADAAVYLQAKLGGSGDISVVNTGLIRSTAIRSGPNTGVNAGLDLTTAHGGRLTVDNAGLIEGREYGMRLLGSAGMTLLMENTGVIRGGATGATISTPLGNIHNAGTIEATDAGGIGLLTGSVETQLVNDGTIAGDVGLVMNSGAEAVIFVNRGTLIGHGGTALEMEGTRNSLILDTGSLLQGDVTATGSGHALQLSGTGATASTFSGFDTFHMAGVDWALAGDASFNTAAFIDSGVLRLQGNVLTTPAMTIANTAMLEGYGSIAGAVTVADGGILSARQGAPLRLDALSLSDGAVLQAALGAPGSVAGVFQVAGDLVLDGRLDVSDLGGFGSGVYRIFDYGGSLTDNGLEIGALPGMSAASVQTSIPGQVNLAASVATGPLSFWDGNGVANDGGIGGGDGIWDAASTRWTDAAGAFNGPWGQAFGVFQAAPGQVTIDNSSGQVAATGLQFASDGYRVTGGALRLDAPETIIRVGTGAAGDTGMTATIENTLFGTGNLIKRDFGRLILDGDSGAYAGASDVREGTLEVNGVLGGTVSVQSGATLAGSGAVGSTTLAAGAILAPGSSRGEAIGTLTINGDFTGQGGTLLLDTELAGDSARTDVLRITGNSGGQAELQVRNANGAGAQTSDGIRVVEVGGSSNATFDLIGRAVAGQYEYFLFKGDRSGAGGDWYLRSALPDTGGPIEPPLPPEPVLRPEPGAYLANQAAAVDMFQLRYQDRHGDPSTPSGRTGGWARVTRNQADFGAVGRQLEVSSDRTVLQVGADLFGRGQDSRFTAGVMLASGTAQNQVSSGLTGYTAKGRVRGTAVGAYGTWLQSTDGAGLYVDGWAQYGRHDNRVDGLGLRRERYDSRASTASLEAGYTFTLVNRSRTAWSLQPQVQVRYTDYDSDSVVEANGTRVDGADAGGFSTRVGLQLQGHAVSRWNRVQPFVAVNWLHDARENALHFDAEKRQAGIPKDRYEVKAGAQLQLGANWAAWGDMAVQNGSEGYRDVAGQIGLRRAW